jgi:RNA recognition motif-containing protein
MLEEGCTKFFVGGIHMETTTNELRSHFEKMGEVVDCVTMRHEDGQCKGFGFVTFRGEHSCQAGPGPVFHGKPTQIKNAVAADEDLYYSRPLPRRQEPPRETRGDSAPTDTTKPAPLNSAEECPTVKSSEQNIPQEKQSNVPSDTACDVIPEKVKQRDDVQQNPSQQREAEKTLPQPAPAAAPKRLRERDLVFGDEVEVSSKICKVSERQ